MGEQKTTKETTRLVIQAQAGDKQAFAKLYEIFLPSTYYLSYKYLRNEDLAAEMAQEVFAIAYENITTLLKPVTFHKWLNTITYNRCISLLRQRERENMHTTQAKPDAERVEALDREGRPDQSLEDKEQEDFLVALIDSLPLAKRTPLYLHYYEGFSPAEIAQMTNQKAGTVRKTLHTARRDLRTKLDLAGATSMSAMATGPAIEKALKAQAEKILTSQAPNSTYKSLLTSVGLSNSETATTVGATSALSKGAGATVAKVALATLTAGAALAGGAYLYGFNKPADAQPAPVPQQTQATPAATAPVQEETVTPQPAPQATNEKAQEPPTQQQAQETPAAQPTQPKPKPQPTKEAPTPPTLTVAAKSLTYPTGPRVSKATIIADAGAKARSGTGATLPVTIELYDLIDFTQPGQYMVALNAQDTKRTNAKTVMLRLTIEEPRDE